MAKLCHICKIPEDQPGGIFCSSGAHPRLGTEHKDQVILPIERNRSSMGACACMGPQYDEPYCYCSMIQRGIPLSPLREAANKKAEEDLNKLFGPGGDFYKAPPDDV